MVTSTYGASGSSGKRPDFVTALMGDRWLEVEWRKAVGGKADRLKRQTEGGTGRGGRFAAPLSTSQRIGNAIGVPQAVVKVIAGGGVAGRGELTAQLKYLSRDGDLALEEASSDFRGLVATRGDIDEVAAAWAQDWADVATHDGRYARANSKTFHLLVSFPEGTDVERAKAAAWGFADKLCHSGEYGDEWRNIRAWHEDRAHPHLHMIIDRRGASGRMMKIHPAAEINPGVLRALQVDVAAEQGIALNDTPRASRGLSRPPQSSREWRAGQKTGRRGRTAMRDRYAVLTKGFAQDCAKREAKAQHELANRLQERGQTGLAQTLSRAAHTLETGGELKIMDGEAAREITPETLQAMDTQTLADTVAGSIREAEDLAPQMRDEAQRVALEVETGKIRTGFAHLLAEEERIERPLEQKTQRPEVPGYEGAIANRARLDVFDPGRDEPEQRSDLNQPSRSGSDQGGYASNAWARVGEADARVVEAYEAKGMNGERALARIIGGRAAEPETLAYWREEEIKELMHVSDVPRGVATGEIEQLQKTASQTYRETQRDIEQGRESVPVNEIDRSVAADARVGVVREDAVSQQPDDAGGATARIDLSTADAPVDAQALRAQIGRDAGDLATDRSAREQDRDMDRGPDLDLN